MAAIRDDQCISLIIDQKNDWENFISEKEKCNWVDLSDEQVLAIMASFDFYKEEMELCKENNLYLSACANISHALEAALLILIYSRCKDLNNLEITGIKEEMKNKFPLKKNEWKYLSKWSPSQLFIVSQYMGWIDKNRSTNIVNYRNYMHSHNFSKNHIEELKGYQNDKNKKPLYNILRKKFEEALINFEGIHKFIKPLFNNVLLHRLHIKNMMDHDEQGYNDQL